MSDRLVLEDKASQYFYVRMAMQYPFIESGKIELIFGKYPYSKWYVDIQDCDNYIISNPKAIAFLNNIRKAYLEKNHKREDFWYSRFYHHIHLASEAPIKEYEQIVYIKRWLIGET